VPRDRLAGEAGAAKSDLASLVHLTSLPELARWMRIPPWARRRAWPERPATKVGALTRSPCGTFGRRRHRDARSLLGCAGFSCQSSRGRRCPARGSRSATLRRWARAARATSHRPRLRRWNWNERLVVHLVDVVAREDEMTSPGCWRIISRLSSTASAVPRYHSDGRPRAMYGWSMRTPPALRSRSHGRPAPM